MTEDQRQKRTPSEAFQIVRSLLFCATMLAIAILSMWMGIAYCFVEPWTGFALMLLSISLIASLAIYLVRFAPHCPNFKKWLPPPRY